MDQVKELTLQDIMQAMLDFRGEVHERFEQVDKRFEQVDKRFEQVDKRFEQVDKRFEQVDKRFEQVDKRFEQVDKRFEQVDGRFQEHENRFDRMEEAILQNSRDISYLSRMMADGFTEINQRFNESDERFDRLERYMKDGFAALMKKEELMEEHLQAHWSKKKRRFRLITNEEHPDHDHNK